MPAMTGANELRAIVRAMDNENEGFNDRYTAEELVAIYRALFASEWDISPSRWSAAQVEAALRGETPTWDEQGRATG